MNVNKKYRRKRTGEILKVDWIDEDTGDIYGKAKSHGKISRLIFDKEMFEELYEEIHG